MLLALSIGRVHAATTTSSLRRGPCRLTTGERE
jgi:hypothetical protein